MIVGVCHKLQLLAPFVARTVGLEEGYESFKHRVWAGGVDVFFDREEELKTFLERYGEYTYSTRMEELEEVVGKLLKERGIKLCTAESCTAGLLSARIVNVAGSSQYFVGGFVVYSNELKTKLLGVEERAIREHGAVSEEVCRQMAIGALEETDADIALAITGISGPSGATKEKPVGLTYIGLATDKEVIVKRFYFKGGRNENRLMATQWALEILRRYLLGRL